MHSPNDRLDNGQQLVVLLVFGLCSTFAYMLYKKWERSISLVIPYMPDNFFVALDCEMVEVCYPTRRSALARCSIVSYDGDVIYDKYIRPKEKITDYRTRWSGIRPDHMFSAVPEDQALQEICNCLENRIIIGHGLDHDLRVLKLEETPCYMLRDTSQCQRLQHLLKLKCKIKSNKLKDLTFHLLGRRIQSDPSGHNSVEDATACLQLFRLVKSDWEPELILHWMNSGFDMEKIVMEMQRKDSAVFSFLSSIIEAS